MAVTSVAINVGHKHGIPNAAANSHAKISAAITEIRYKAPNHNGMDTRLISFILVVAAW